MQPGAAICRPASRFPEHARNRREPIGPAQPRPSASSIGPNPSGAVGQDVEHAPAVRHEVAVSRGDWLPAVAAGVVGVGQAEHGQ